MKYRESYMMVFAVTLVLSPLTIRAIDRAEAEIERQNQMFMALQTRNSEQCDMPVPLALDAPGGCIRVNRVAFNGLDTLSPLLVAAMY